MNDDGKIFGVFMVIMFLCSPIAAFLALFGFIITRIVIYFLDIDDIIQKIFYMTIFTIGLFLVYGYRLYIHQVSGIYIYKLWFFGGWTVKK